MNPMSLRLAKVSMNLQSRMMEIFLSAQLIDSRLENNMFTITKINLTADLKIANCYVVPTFGKSNLSGKELIAILQENSKKIRYLATNKINLKYSPELRFRYDDSLDKLSAVEKIINSIK